MTNPCQEAEDRLGGRYEVRVLEPSPPALDGNLDDPTARGEHSGTRQLVSPVTDGDLTWDELAREDEELAEWRAARWLGAWAPLAAVPAEFADSRQPGASREVLLETLKVEDSASGMSAFAAQLFTNNSSVCILAFALGFAFGIPSLLLLVQNMALLGAFLWLYNSQGLLPEFSAWLAVHGTTEFFAIMLSSAAGIHIGRKMAFPGRRSILSAASEAGQRGAQVMVGVVLMLIFAAVLEAFPRQLASTETRGLIGGFMLIFWLTYFFAFGRNREAAAA